MIYICKRDNNLRILDGVVDLISNELIMSCIPSLDIQQLQNLFDYDYLKN